MFNVVSAPTGPKSSRHGLVPAHVQIALGVREGWQTIPRPSPTGRSPIKVQAKAGPKGLQFLTYCTDKPLGTSIAVRKPEPFPSARSTIASANPYRGRQLRRPEQHSILSQLARLSGLRRGSRWQRCHPKSQRAKTRYRACRRQYARYERYQDCR